MSWLFSKAFTDEHLSRLQARIYSEAQRADILLSSMSPEEQRGWEAWSAYRSAVKTLQAKINQGWLLADVRSETPLLEWPKGDPCSCDDYGSSHRQAVASKRVRPSSQWHQDRQSTEQSSADGSCSSFENACERDQPKKKEKCRREICVSLRYLQELAEEYSVDTSLDGEQFAQLNVMPTPHKFLRNDKTMESSDLSRFGLTCAVLTENHGEELLMSFLAGFHARTLARPAAALASMGTSQGSGGKWQESSMKYDLNTSSWKTHLSLLEEDLHESLVTLPKLGLIASGVVFQQKNVARLIRETVYGWSGEMFATPQARDYRSGSLARWNDPRRSRNLNDQVGGLLNPKWEEWLMGWPTGWTELKPLAMDKFQEWLQQHSTFSQTPEVKNPEAA